MTPLSQTFQYEDKLGFLGEDIIIECAVQPGKITWSVFRGCCYELAYTIKAK